MISWLLTLFLIYNFVYSNCRYNFIVLIWSSTILFFNITILTYLCFFSWYEQLQGIWWNWRNWNRLEPSETGWCYAISRTSRKSLFRGSLTENTKTWKHNQIICFLGGWWEENYQHDHWIIHFREFKTVSHLPRVLSLVLIYHLNQWTRTKLCLHF